MQSPYFHTCDQNRSVTLRKAGGSDTAAHNPLGRALEEEGKKKPRGTDKLSCQAKGPAA